MANFSPSSATALNGWIILITFTQDCPHKSFHKFRIIYSSKSQSFAKMSCALAAPNIDMWHVLAGIDKSRKSGNVLRESRLKF